MNFKSPVHLIIGRYPNLETLTAAELDAREYEILREILFGNGIAYRRGNVFFSVAEVKNAFNSLRSDLPFYLKLHKSRPLLNFLERGDFRFLEDKRTAALLADPQFKTKIQPLFVQAKAHIINSTVAAPTHENLYKLAAIKLVDIPIDPATEQILYADSIAFLQKFADSFDKLTDQVFTTAGGFTLLPDIRRYVNIQVSRMLKHLPPVFAKPTEEFARHLHNKLLTQAVERGRATRFQHFSNEDLHILLLAAQTDKMILNPPNAAKFIELFRKKIGNNYRPPAAMRPLPRPVAAPVVTAAPTASAGKSTRLTGAPTPQGTLQKERDFNFKPYLIGGTCVFVLALFAWMFTGNEAAANDPAIAAYDADKWEKVLNKLEEDERKRQFAASVKKTKEAEKKGEKKEKVSLLKEFNQNDLYGSWVTFRTLDGGGKIDYKYNIVNPTQGERVLTYTNRETEEEYSVRQPFKYSLRVVKWNEGQIYIEPQRGLPVNCTRTEADTLLRRAERNIGVEEFAFEKKSGFDFNIPENRSQGLRFNQVRHRPSSDIEDIGLFATDDRRAQFMVGYINNLLERNGVSIGRDPTPLRWYADATADNWMVKRGGKPYKVAEVVMSRKKMYFKPVEFTPEDSKILPLFNLRNVYYIDARGRKKQGNMKVTYHRKGDYFSVGVKEKE